MFSTFNSPVKAPLVRSGLLRCPPPELLSCDVHFKQIEVGSLGEYQKQNLGPGRRRAATGLSEACTVNRKLQTWTTVSDSATVRKLYQRAG